MIQAEGSQDEGQKSALTFTPGHKALKLGVMRVMLSCLSSIAAQLRESENETSKDLLLKYFTTESVKDKFEILSVESYGFQNSVDDAVIGSQLVPLFLQIVAVIWKLKDVEIIVKKKGSSNTVIGLDPVKLLSHFMKYAKSFPKQACIHTYAAATVEIVKTLHGEEVLFNEINTPLKLLLTTVRLPHGLSSLYHLPCI